MPVSFHPQRSELGRANGVRAEAMEVVGGEGIHADLRNDTGVIVRDDPGSDLLPDLAQARKKNKSLLTLSNYSKDFQGSLGEGEKTNDPCHSLPGQFYEREECRRLPETVNIHFG